METLYRIEELTTTGWELIEDKEVQLTRVQAKERLDSYLAEGIPPARLRAIPDTAQPAN